jgi:hypothetical protein
LEANTVQIKTGAKQVSVWLSPELIDFKRRVKVTLNGKSINGGDGFVEPDLTVLLEDARTRADRQHPFWAKLENSRSPGMAER